MSTPPNIHEHENRAYEMKLSIHKRDELTCLNCGESFEDANNLHAHHIVPRGDGGSTNHRNLASLCKRCHEAIHEGDGFAPTIRCQSTGDMVQKDFIWFRHFWKEMLPALSQAAGKRTPIQTYFNDPDRPYQAWHVPLGDLRTLDDLLADAPEIEYSPMGVCHYM